MPFPISLTSKLTAGGNVDRTVILHSGLTVIVGPNGSGKTALLRGLKGDIAKHINGKRVRYLSAGRASPVEQYRSDYDGYRGDNPRYEDAFYGSADDVSRRHSFETLQGDFLTLAARADIQVKVRERLRKLFARDVFIEWDAGNLKIRFSRTSGGQSYSSAREASGLLNLVGLLSALYDDGVGALLIDEPEVSLHPQLQSFLLTEMLRIGGVPDAISNRKLIVLATHSTEFLQLDYPARLSTFIFVHDISESPVQVSPDAGELKSKAVIGLIARMSQEHKLALFAKSPLLVEGPSDSIVCGGLANRLELSLEAGGSQLLPVIGKGQFPVVVKLFRLLGKSPVILADADGLTDGLDLANLFLDGPGIKSRVASMGFATGYDLSRTVYRDFCELVEKRWAEIKAMAELHVYWVTRDPADPDVKKFQRRAAFCTLFVQPEQSVSAIASDGAWLTIKNRLTALLDVLETQGCFILRRGTIESYYHWVAARGNLQKPTAAAEEVAHFGPANLQALNDAYPDVIRCLKCASSQKPIVEAESLRDLLLSVAAPALGRVAAGDVGDLNNLARAVLGNTASLFELKGSAGQLEIQLTTKILDVVGFPIVLTPDDNLIRKVSAALGLQPSKMGAGGSGS